MSFLWNRNSGNGTTASSSAAAGGGNSAATSQQQQPSSSSASIAAAFAGGNKTTVTSSIHTQEDLNRFMAAEEARLAAAAAAESAAVAAGAGGSGARTLIMQPAASPVRGLFGGLVNALPSHSSAVDSSAGALAALFGTGATTTTVGGAASSGNGVEVMFGLGANNSNGAGASGGANGLDLAAAALSANPNNNNITAILGSDARQRLAALLHQHQQPLSGVSSSSSMASAAATAAAALTPKQLRMLRMWNGLGITDIALSVTNAKRWVHTLLAELVKDVQRCNKALAGRNMSDLDCNHSLTAMHKTSAAATTTVGAGAAAPAPAVGGFGAPAPAPAAGGFGGGFGAAAAAAAPAAVGGFGAPKPAIGGFGAAPAAGGFGAPAAAAGGFGGGMAGGFGAAAAAAPLTKGQQLLNDKAALSQQLSTADTMDLAELINLRLALEKTLDATNSIMYRAARSSAAPAAAAAPASAVGGFGAAGAGGFGGFGAPAAGGFGAPAAVGGFGAPAAAGGFGAAKPPVAATAAAAASDAKSLTSPQERQYHRPYIIHRLESLAANRNMAAFTNDGFDIEGWNEALPLDAHLILHVLQLRCPRLFADAVRLAHFPEHSSQAQTPAFRPSAAAGAPQPAASPVGGACPTIHVGSVGEPYFFVEAPRGVSAGGGAAAASQHLFAGASSSLADPSSPAARFHNTLQTSDSLFEALVLFAALMRRSRPNDTQVPDGFYAIVA